MGLNNPNNPCLMLENHYSRQLYVLGSEAQHKLGNSSVLVVNLSSVGLEVAKNLVLAGVKTLYIHDPQIISPENLNTGYCFQDFVGKRVDLSICNYLADLNSFVEVKIVSSVMQVRRAEVLNLDEILAKNQQELFKANEPLINLETSHHGSDQKSHAFNNESTEKLRNKASKSTGSTTKEESPKKIKYNAQMSDSAKTNDGDANEKTEVTVIDHDLMDFLADYNLTVVVSCNLTNAENLFLSKMTNFVMCNTDGLFSRVFVDFKRDFDVLDSNGEPLLSGNFCEIADGTLFMVEKERHNLENGDFVKIFIDDNIESFCTDLTSNICNSGSFDINNHDQRVEQKLPSANLKNLDTLVNSAIDGKNQLSPLHYKDEQNISDGNIYEVRVLSPFEIKLVGCHGNTGSGYFEQVKIPVKVDFDPLEDFLHRKALPEILFVSDSDIEKQAHDFYHIYDQLHVLKRKFIKEQRKLLKRYVTRYDISSSYNKTKKISFDEPKHTNSFVLSGHDADTTADISQNPDLNPHNVSSTNKGTFDKNLFAESDFQQYKSDCKRILIDELTCLTEIYQKSKPKFVFPQEKDTLHALILFYIGIHENIMPVCSVVGGFVAQEAIKACTNKFMPLRQFMYYNCHEIAKDFSISDSHGLNTMIFETFSNIFSHKASGSSGFINIKDLKECENDVDSRHKNELIAQNPTKTSLIAHKSPVSSLISGSGIKTIEPVFPKEIDNILLNYASHQFLVDFVLQYTQNAHLFISFDHRYSSFVRLFGLQNLKKLLERQSLILGAGAIGCEHLKNATMLGIGSLGKTVLVDMDSIELSNLNRQFLFRKDDIGKMKSEIAIQSVCKMNTSYLSHNFSHIIQEILSNSFLDCSRKHLEVKKPKKNKKMHRLHTKNTKKYEEDTEYVYESFSGDSEEVKLKSRIRLMEKKKEKQKKLIEINNKNTPTCRGIDPSKLREIGESTHNVQVNLPKANEKVFEEFQSLDIARQKKSDAVPSLDGSTNKNISDVNILSPENKEKSRRRVRFADQINESPDDLCKNEDATQDLPPLHTSLMIETTKEKSQSLCLSQDLTPNTFKSSLDANKLLALTTRVGKTTENIYTNKFLHSMDFITNALDNVETRRYIDSRCTLLKIPLFESGTLGTKGNTQIIIPDLHENYSASVDPPEKEIPMCTLRNFPYNNIHCIEYSVSEFKRIFSDEIEKILELQQRLKKLIVIDEITSSNVRKFFQHMDDAFSNEDNLSKGYDRVFDQIDVKLRNETGHIFDKKPMNANDISVKASKNVDTSCEDTLASHESKDISSNFTTNKDVYYQHVAQAESRLNSNVQNWVDKNLQDLDEETIQALKLMAFSKKQCLTTAFYAFFSNFYVKIQKWLITFPVDHVTKEGTLFWSAPKKAPNPIDFDFDEYSIGFIISMCELIGITSKQSFCVNQQDVMDFYNQHKSEIYDFLDEKYQQMARDKSRHNDADQKDIIIEDSGIDKKDVSAGSLNNSDNSVTSASLLNKHASTQTKVNYPVSGSQRVNLFTSLESKEFLLRDIYHLLSLDLVPIEFEKDDDLHIKFITAYTNLRAKNYRIKHTPAQKAKQIAGKIIPAIATTTASVSGLTYIEVIKHVLGSNSYMNHYMSLGLPYFGGSEPLKPLNSKYFLMDSSKSCPKDCISSHSINPSNHQNSDTDESVLDARKHLQNAFISNFNGCEQLCQNGYSSEFNIWKQIPIHDCTLNTIKAFFKAFYDKNVEMIVCNDEIVYASYYNADEFSKNLDKKLSELTKEDLIFVDVSIESETEQILPLFVCRK